MRIVADSSCDLYSLDTKDFKSVPLSIYTDERTFVDNPDLNITEMLDYLASYKGRSYTSCPSSDAWMQSFEGADEIFVLTVTSSLSGSYNSAVNAVNMWHEEHPETKISVIDSLSTGAEEILVLQKLTGLIKEGLPFDEIDHAIREYLKQTRLFFSFFSLHNLSQNGRVSKAAASILCVLNIAVCGTAAAEGTIAVNNKARGRHKVIRVMMEGMEKAGYHGGKAVITHVENEELAELLKESVLKKYPFADIDIFPARGLCSYYMERHGIVIACDTGSVRH